MTALVERDYAVVEGEEEWDLVAPVVRVAGIAMEEKNGRPSALVGVEKVHFFVLEKWHADVLDRITKKLGYPTLWTQWW